MLVNGSADLFVNSTVVKQGTCRYTLEPFDPWNNPFTLKQLDTHGVLGTLATDALLLKHQALSINNADEIFIVFDQFHTKILENEITFWIKIPRCLRVKKRLQELK